MDQAKEVKAKRARDFGLRRRSRRLAATATKEVALKKPPDPDADKDETEPRLHSKRTPTTRNVTHSKAGEVTKSGRGRPRAPCKPPVDESDSRSARNL